MSNVTQKADGGKPEVSQFSVVDAATELLRRREIQKRYADATSATERMSIRHEGGPLVFPALFTGEFLSYEAEFVRARSYVVQQVITLKEWKKIIRHSDSFDALIKIADAETKKLMELPELPPHIEKWLDWQDKKKEFDHREFMREFGRDGSLTPEAYRKHCERMKPCDLYRYYDYRGDLLYIGISKDALRRGYQHSKTAQWADRFAMMEREVCFSRAEAEKAELRAIREEKPLFNIMHSVRGAA